MRFFADQCVPREIVAMLRERGHEVIAVRDVIAPRSPDPVVIRAAQDLGCVLLSLDGDFADIVTYPPRDYGGIVAIQLHNHPEIIPALMERLLAFLDAHPDPEELRGKLIIVEVHRIRLRS